MTRFQPQIQVTCDERALSAAEAGLVSARVSLGLGAAHDAVELKLWRRSKFASARAGSVLSLQLDGEDVWSGEVTEVAATAEVLLLRGLAGTVVLSRARKNQTYAGESVANIVRDLASDLTVDEVEGDTTLDSYTVDDRRSIWSHLGDLARLTGAERAASASGGLRFVKPRTGTAELSLRYGSDVLAFEAGTGQASTADKVSAYGAGSEAGAQKWHWLLAQPAAAGGGAGPLRIEPALHTRNNAEKLAQAYDAGARRSGVLGQLTLRGVVGLRPGSLFEVSDLPATGLSSLRALRVEHVLDGRAGYLTLSSFEGAA